MQSAQVPRGFAVLAIMSCTKPGDMVVEVTWDAVAEPVIATTALALMRVPAVVGGGVFGQLVLEQFIKVSCPPLSSAAEQDSDLLVWLCGLCAVSMCASPRWPAALEHTKVLQEAGAGGLVHRHVQGCREERRRRGR